MTFKRFVVFAEMRTGSNLLEATMNAIKRVTCFGEAFNPYLLGWPDCDQIRGLSIEERDADPHRLLRAIFDRDDHLSGFRYFHDHDPRVFDAIMEDRDCAKIVLTRNPLDSYVSVRLAWETNQWKLNETETPVPAAITFDGAEFRAQTAEITEFQLRVMHGLQSTGQSAFWLGYEDLRDADVMTGLMHWLGRRDLDRVLPASDQVPQNPREMREKVVNFDDMQAELARMDPFGADRIPSFEPRRGPAVPSFVASEAGQGLVFMPVRGGPTDPVTGWLRGLDAEIVRDFTQNSLRQWKRGHARHRSFCVLRHPVRRAHAAFRAVLDGTNAELRQTLRQIHRVDLPEDAALASLSEDDEAPLFAQFLGFLRRNLNGQTTLSVHPGWATQSHVLEGFARFGSPDLIAREATLTADLGYLAQSVGLPSPPASALGEDRFPAYLDDKPIQQAARAAYLRDYIAFGFTNQA